MLEYAYLFLNMTTSALSAISYQSGHENSSEKIRERYRLGGPPPGKEKAHNYKQCRARIVFDAKHAAAGLRALSCARLREQAWKKFASATAWGALPLEKRKRTIICNIARELCFMQHTQTTSGLPGTSLEKIRERYRLGGPPPGKEKNRIMNNKFKILFSHANPTQKEKLAIATAWEALIHTYI